MQGRVFLICFSILFPLSSSVHSAQRKRIQPPQYFKSFQSREDKDNLTRVVLRNGLTILIEEQALYPLAAVVLYVKTNEREEEVGMADLLAETYRGTDLVPQTLLHGGIWNAQSSYDRTCYFSIVPAENVNKILEINLEFLHKPRFGSDQIVQAAQRLVEKSRRNLRLPLSFAKERVVKLVDGGARTTAERLSKVKSVSQDRLGRFHQAYYHPKNVILSISGAVFRERILKKVVELYAPLKASGAGRALKTYSPSFSGGSSFQYRHLRGELQEPSVLLAYRVPGVRHKDYYALRLFSYVLGQGRGSLLHQYLVQSGSAFSVESSLMPYEAGAIFLISFTPDLENIDHAEVQALAQVEILRRRRLGVADLDRAKSLLLKDHYESLQTLEWRAHSLARHEALGTYQNLAKVPAWIEELTSEDIKRVLGRYFSNSNLSVLEYFPHGAAERTFTAKSFLEVLRLLIPTVAGERAAEMDALYPFESKSTFSPIQFTPSYLKYELKRTSILRGPVVYFQEEHALPLVHMAFFWPGGRIRESEANAGITELMMGTLLRKLEASKGSLHRNELEQMGAEIRVLNELDFFGIQATVLSPYREKMFSALLDWWRNPELKEEDLELERKRILSLVRQSQENDLLFAFDSARKQVFGQHPYGLPRYGSKESLSIQTLESVRSWMDKQLTRVHPLILIRGDLKGTSFLQDFVSVLSDSHFKRRQPVQRATGRDGPRKGSAFKPISVVRNGVVLLALKSPVRGSRDERLLNAVENLMVIPGGPLLGSAQNPAGLSLDITLFHESGLNGGIMYVVVRTTPEKKDEVHRQLLVQWVQMKNASSTRKDLMSALVATLTQFYMRQQRGTDYLLDLGRNTMAGKSENYESEYLATIKDANREEIVSVINQYF